jgi:ABC-type branched-subunit amino acid transport system permease subunit
VLGVIYIVVVLFAPDGIAGLLRGRQARAGFRDRS